MSPHLFMLAYEIVIRELQERAPQAHMFIYTDDIAVVTTTGQQMHDIIQVIQDSIPSVGMPMNAEKTQIYHWAPNVTKNSIQGIPVQPPIFVYLGYHIAYIPRPSPFLSPQTPAKHPFILLRRCV